MYIRTIVCFIYNIKELQTENDWHAISVCNKAKHQILLNSIQKKKKLARISLLSNKIHKAGLFIKLAVLFQEFFKKISACSHILKLYSCSIFTWIKKSKNCSLYLVMTVFYFSVPSSSYFPRPDKGWNQAFYKATLWWCYFTVVNLLQSDHSIITLFWVHTNMVKQINSFKVYLLVRVTINWF